MIGERGPPCYWARDRDAVRVVWRAIPTPPSVRVQRRVGPGWEDVSDWLDAKAGAWTDEAGRPDENIGYRLVARTPAGVAGPSGPVLEVTEPTRGSDKMFIPLPGQGARRR